MRNAKKSKKLALRVAPSKTGRAKKPYVESEASARRSAPLMEPGEQNPLGGASRAELIGVVESEFGNDPNFEASETAIAIDGLSRVIAARMANAEWPNDPKRLAVFIVSDRVRELAGTLNATREPILDNGSRAITGKLWLAAPSFASGYVASFSSDEPGDVFEEMKSLGLGDRAALVFDPSATEPEIRYYPFGLNQDDRVQRFLIAKETFSLDDLDRVLTQFHEDNVITPDAALPDFTPWLDGAKYVPREHTERFLQGMLKAVLSIAFGKCRVDFEVRGNEGRCDLLISSKGSDPKAWTSHAALEMKVLRSFTSGGKSVSGPRRDAAVNEGLLQAIAYKEERGAQEGMLCCYDMTAPKHSKGPDLFKTIAPKAKKHAIELRRYRIYGTSADLRRDKYGDGSPAA